MSLFHREKAYDYFGGFAACARTACDEAQYLCEALTRFRESAVPQHLKAMHELENQADMKKHDMSRHLAQEFLPPIEREDISSLSQKLDDIVDDIEDVMRYMYMFRVTVLRPEALDFAKLIVRCCQALEKALTEFRHFKKSKTIHDYLIEVNTLESEGDRLHADAIRRLFTEDSTADERLLWIHIFERLECCLDACEHATDVIESVIMKNS